MTGEYVLLSTLASEWDIDKSVARKYVLRHGFDFIRVRSDDRTHQLVLGLTAADAELLREMRSQQGYTTQGKDNPHPVENGTGVFYIVQIMPDADPRRVKLGYATDATRRLASYRTVSPTATIIKTWPCRVSWERAAIDSLVVNDTLIGGEVYSCADIGKLVERGDNFFSYMPCLERK